MTSSKPLRVAIANDFPIVVEGLAAMLAKEPGVEVVDMFVVGESEPQVPIDVVLYDTFGRQCVDLDQVRLLTTSPHVHHLAIFTLSWADMLVDEALASGARGVLSKALSGADLAVHLRAIADGNTVVAPPPSGRAASGSGRDWPGKALSLSERESETLVLLASGLRNAEIAKALFVSEDTVKTHLKRAYRKLGVANRVQATSFVLRHPSFRMTSP
jgi:DNA-binding NarL/FixJ family response regulator